METPQQAAARSSSAGAQQLSPELH